MITRRGMAAWVLAGAGMACTAPAVTLPTAGEPEPQAAALHAAATDACRGAQSFSAEFRVNGTVGAERLRRVTLQGAMTRDGRITLRAVAPVGPPIFVMAGTAARAVLVLPRDHRYVDAAAADIIEALIGLRLTPADWIDLMSGCGAAGAPGPGIRAGRDVVVPVGDDGRARLHREGATWRLVAAERPDARVDYAQFSGRWPSLARFTSRAGAAVPLALAVTIGQIFVNAALPPRAFDLPSTSGMDAMSLSALRAAGPLGEKGGV